MILQFNRGCLLMIFAVVVVLLLAFWIFLIINKKYTLCICSFIVVVYVLLLVGSVFYVKKNPGVNQNYVSLFTGWIGGISTAFLGFLAIFQNKIYNKENGEFLNNLRRIQVDIVQENKNQTVRLKEMQLQDATQKALDNLLSDRLILINQINIPKLIQTYKNSTIKDLYLECLSINITLEYLRSKLSVYHIIDSETNSEIGLVEKESLNNALTDMSRDFTTLISNYIEDRKDLFESISVTETSLVDCFFDIDSRYKYYINAIKGTKKD